MLAACDDSERLLAQTDRRRSFIAGFSWAVPARAAVDAIIAFAGQRQILEICAGSGLWARLIAAAGGDVIASDAADESGHRFTPVEMLEGEAAVRAHPSCQALFVCWPPFADGCASRALAVFSGDRLVVIGDPRFTADRRFHALVSADWRLESELLLPSWPGLDDRLKLFQRGHWP